MVPKVAIACQGGGSHAAFGAGILRELLSGRHRDRFELAGISGTSGGALCAALAWAGLVAENGGPDDAIARLSGFWNTVKAEEPPDSWLNLYGQMAARLPWTFEVSPYVVPAPAARIMRDWLKKHLRLEELAGRPAAPPELLVGATDVVSGDRVVIHGDTLTYEALVASAAVPFLYEAVHVDGRWLWDGLFSVNPPVRDLIRLPIDELWVIQINPQTTPVPPRRTADIIDRRNELSGNIALAQELHFVETINRLLEAQSKLGDGTLPLGDGLYKQVTIRLVDAGLDHFDYASKLDRTPAFIEQLLQAGAAVAADFFAPRSLWPRPGAIDASVKHI